MRAAVITQYGNAPEVVDTERPALPDDSVMIEVHAASINPIDWIIMAGYVQEMLPYELPRLRRLRRRHRGWPRGAGLRGRR